MKFILLFALMGLGACKSLESSAPVERQTSSGTETLKETLLAKLNADTGADFSDATCAQRLAHLQSSLRDINWSAYSNADLKRDSLETIRALWAARARLHAKLPELSRSCALTLRDTFHLLRETEDYLGEFAYAEQAYDPAKVKFQEQRVPILDAKGYPEYYVADSVDAQNFQFKSGDLMLARGISFISAIIAQITDNHSQFSHVVFLNVDEKTHKANTIESYIGVGVSRYEINFALKNENARLLLLRPKDVALGAKAAELLDKKVSEGNGHGGAIPYDYQMNFTDHSKMSCAEIATAGYRWASNGKIVLPTYPSHITMQNEQFLNDISMKRETIFTPDDLEIDPHFDLILDWRDPHLIRDSRYKDAILAAMMKWVGTMNYQFHDTFKSLFAKYIILPSRSTPAWGLVKKASGAPNLDKEIPRKTLGVMTVLGQIGNVMLETIEKEDKNFIAAHGRPMTNEQLHDYIESLRVQDMSRYENHEASMIHYALRPDSLKQRSFGSGNPLGK